MTSRNGGIIGSDNSLVPAWCYAIAHSIGVDLVIGPQRINSGEIKYQTTKIFLREMQLKTGNGNCKMTLVLFKFKVFNRLQDGEIGLTIGCIKYIYSRSTKA